MFILLFIEEMSAFLAANPVLVGLILSAVEYIKRWSVGWAWFKPNYLTAISFVLGFALAIPTTGFVDIDWFAYAAHGFGLGLVATGLYKVGSTLSKNVAVAIAERKNLKL